MPEYKVNLDALIPREDFEVAVGAVDNQSQLTTTFKIADFSSDSLIYNTLRKPDFQRETGDWTPDKVAELVTSFVEGDLIPSVILWRSPSSAYTFVIDGAHRLSALIAWVHDDYGDSHTSLRFFGNSIPEDQRKAAEKTRQLIGSTVGSYVDLSTAFKNLDTVPADKARLARMSGTNAVTLQWVVGGAAKAEGSFFRINQKATPIDDTELDMIKARRKPNAIAARAFIRAGTGHKYWLAFPEPTKTDIEDLGREVYDLIFKPDLDSRIKSTDLPVAGRGYSANSLKMVFELVNFVNGFDPAMWRDEGSSPSRRKGQVEHPILADDVDGSATINCMRRVRRAASRIAGNDPTSLGLHPAVYFYSNTGNFQPAAFLGAIAFVQDLFERQKVDLFTEVRSRFEDYLIEHKYFLNQIARRYGSMQRSVKRMAVMFTAIFDAICGGIEDAAILDVLNSQQELAGSLELPTKDDINRGRNFSRETQNQLVLKEITEKAPQCGICGSRVTFRSITFDHIDRRADGGIGALGNAQLAHPYCNSGFKEKQVAQARKDQASEE